MNANTGRLIAVMAVAAACLGRTEVKAASKESDEAAAMMGDYAAQERAATAAREKDPLWKPACREVGLIKIGDEKKPGAVKNFCLNGEGNILACYASKDTSGKNSSGIRVYSPEGKLLKTMPLEISPTAICVGQTGSMIAAGEGRLLKIDAEGKVLASAVSPVANETVTIGPDTENMVKEMIKQSKRPLKEELAKMKTNLEKRRSDVTGLATTDQDVFMAVPAPSDFSYRVYRFNLDLKEPKLVVEKLRGCCGQMDIQAHDNKLWIPHNARHCVECRDREGKEVSKFGTSGKVKPKDFGGCCEPKNLRILSNGDILAAESGPPTCIKRFSADGKFKEVVALAGNSKGDCVRVSVEMSADGKRYYMLDTTRDVIRVFQAKS